MKTNQTTMNSNKIKFYALFFCLFIVGSHCYSQTITTSNIEKYNETKNRFEEKWIGKKFPLSDELTFSMDNSMIFMGFSGCIPCEYQLPFLVEFAIEQPKYNFIYISFNSLEVIEAEFARLKLDIKSVPNFSIVSINKEKITNSGLSDFGYPAAYFLNKNKIIKSVEKAGYIKGGKQFLIEQWLPKLLLTLKN